MILGPPSAAASSEALLAGSEALLAGSEALLAGSKAHQAGSETLPASSMAHPAGSEALLAEKISLCGDAIGHRPLRGRCPLTTKLTEKFTSKNWN